MENLVDMLFLTLHDVLPKENVNEQTNLNYSTR